MDDGRQLGAWPGARSFQQQLDWVHEASMMTPEARALIYSLVLVPGRPYEGDPEAILRHFGTDDGRGLGLRLLHDAIEEENADDAAAALLVCSAFGLDDEHLLLYHQLIYADWHFEHEHLVSLIGSFRSAESVEALYHAATWVPDYLDYDENRALAVNALWALGDTPGPEAENALRRLSESDNEVVQQGAKGQLERRKERDAGSR